MDYNGRLPASFVEHFFHHFSLLRLKLGWVTFVTPDVNQGFTC